MRHALVIGLVATLAPAVLAQAPKEPDLSKRYGSEYQPEAYPQKTPKDTLSSVLKAIERKRFTYLLAHLVDPAFVDARVKIYAGNFDELVTEATARFANNPDQVRDLQRFLADGQWQEQGEAASAQLADIKNRAVYFRKIKDRWFLENQSRPK